ncbi:hypothetical protein F966_03335 [Acinetobacter higginsii]|uniref:DUF2523 domain-containing protein n=1 Tax=Acinetobacter higginsii TaxID=70347 RepID=N8W882_9GAMM|nr:DUF2523 family protein [Acinetobacter higginsii]ENV08272.1 hypothetical protein F966_03335 [Acinetobacter higginsii]
MQALLIPLLGLFARYFIARALVGAGLSVITYMVLNSFVQELKDLLQGYFYDIPSNFFYVVHLLKFDFYLSTIISCYTIAMSVKSAKLMIGKA